MADSNKLEYRPISVREALTEMKDVSEIMIDLAYSAALFNSDVAKELYRVRNFHQAFHRGLWWGLYKAGLQYVLGGRILKGRLTSHPDFSQLKTVNDFYGTDSPSDEDKGTVKFDGERTFDKETDVYY